MESTEAPGASQVSTSEKPAIRLRSYQEEMYETSLKRNVIVVMDTGSGKTHVAIYRIRKQLESSHGLVWFMCPSVALSSQQYEVLKEQLPSYLIKALTGMDGVDKWTTQRLWDGVLTNVRVVVGTPKVLEEALTHGFVQLANIDLLVFDEAHHCTSNHPANIIMRNFYHPAKRNGRKVPHVLGLTASPIMSANAATLATVETNLDAVAITPTKHRSELEAYVHPPKLSKVMYTPFGGSDIYETSSMYGALARAVDSYDLSTDPYIQHLLDIGDERSQELSRKPNTYCYKQLKTLKQRATAVREDLGFAAAEWYLRRCIQRFQDTVRTDTSLLVDIAEREKLHLRDIFNRLISDRTEEHSIDEHQLSQKVHLLIDLLQRHSSPVVRGIVFVEQRAVVTALAHLLNTELQATYSVGSFVGTSTFGSRKTAVADLVDLKEQQQDLNEFRNGVKNLMVATNVLEEGIDVTACNLVVCFDPPKNLISFVQRRGRARQHHAEYVVFLSENDLAFDPNKWLRLEAEMKKAYMDEARQSGLAEAEEESLEERQYHVENTRALLTFANAKAHLYHFCAVSSRHASRYVDLRPEFATTKTDMVKPWTARVTLPSFVHPSFRMASSSRGYSSDAAAIMDAAFESFVALHQAGLVNDNLLPLHDDGPNFGHMEQPSIMEVLERQTSWSRLFRGVRYQNIEWHAGTLDLLHNDRVVTSAVIWLPSTIPDFAPFNLYWNEDTTYVARIQPAGECLSEADSLLPGSQKFTQVMLEFVHGSRMDQSRSYNFPVLFSPTRTMVDIETIASWEGYQSAATLVESSHNPTTHGLVRVKSQANRPYIYSSVEIESDAMHQSKVVVTPFPKRKDFLHPIEKDNTRNNAYTSMQAFATSDCVIDNLPSQYALLAAFVPSITHRLDVTLVAQILRSTLLAELDIRDLTLITEAISSPGACEGVDYNRLEFLGDRILKFCAVLHVISQHLNWPEGYLVRGKDQIVSNARLSKAALDHGLDRYVLDKSFTGSKWRPLHVEDTPDSHESRTREMSSKTLGNVVEALIGAAYVDGGLEKASKCVRVLFRDEDWDHHRTAIDRLVQELGPSERTNLELLEKLVGHHFSHPNLLLEAITHASSPRNSTGLSYERLEFLGDAVLDLIINPSGTCQWRLPQLLLHDYSIEEEKYEVIAPEGGREEQPQLKKSARAVHLHDFIRAGISLLSDKRHSLEAFGRFRERVEEGLERSAEYPWPDLIAMRPQKVFSDLVESMLGALFLDAHGDVAVCEAFIERLGIFRHMRRFLDESVETAFPKERVGILADRETVEYIVTQMGAEDIESQTACVVRIGGRDVARVVGCGSKQESEVRAACEAVKVLEARLKLNTGSRKRKLDVGLKNGRHESISDEDVDSDVL